MMGEAYAVRRWDGIRRNDTHVEFRKDWFRHLKVDERRRYTDRETTWRSHKPIFICFPNEEIMLN
jgi:hypothetical protein